MARENYQLGDAKMQNQRGNRGRMKVAEKPKNFRTAIVHLAEYCSRFLWIYILAFSMAIASATLTMFGPDRLSDITNLINEGMKSGHVDLDAIFSIGKFLAIFYVCSAVLTYCQNFTLATVTQKVLNSMRKDIDSKLARLPLSKYDSSSFGDLLSRVTNDVDTIGMSLNNALGQFISAVFIFIGCTIMMFITNVYLALVALVTSSVGFVIINVLLKKSQPYFSRRQLYLGLLNGHIEEIYAGHVIVKAFNGEKEAKEEFDRLNRLMYENNMSAQFFSGVMQPLMGFVSNFSYIAVCIIGAIMAKNGMISFGTIVAFITYVRMFTMPLGQVAQSITDLQSAAAAEERVYEFLNDKEMEDESYKTTVFDTSNCKGEVSFQHVNFGYVPERTIIHDFSAMIKPGENVAIVGPTGAGKTTLVNLLMRFYELNGGSISIDGIKTTDLTRENVHDLFCMVLQDTWLFNGTIRENVRFNMDYVTDEQVVEACKAVGLHNHIMHLAHGYDTQLTDDSNMSQGQKQLLTIARAMINRAPLLILDEATSSVDTRTEQIVQNAMNRLTEGRTSFTIAHRLSTIRNADVILVLKDGDIVETGRHEELLEKGGFYAQLWQSQFVNAEAI